MSRTTSIQVGGGTARSLYETGQFMILISTSVSSLELPEYRNYLHSLLFTMYDFLKTRECQHTRPMNWELACSCCCHNYELLSIHNPSSLETPRIQLGGADGRQCACVPMYQLHCFSRGNYWYLLTNSLLGQCHTSSYSYHSNREQTNSQFTELMGSVCPGMSINISGKIFTKLCRNHCPCKLETSCSYGANQMHPYGHTGTWIVSQRRPGFIVCTSPDENKLF